MLDLHDTLIVDIETMHRRQSPSAAKATAHARYFQGVKELAEAALARVDEEI